MAKVITKNSFTPGSAPSGLSAGEMAVNVADKKIFVGNAVGGVVTLHDQNAVVTSVNGATGAVTNINAATSTITNTNSSSTFYPAFVGGTGNTAFYIDAVTTPLSYVPSTGTLNCRIFNGTFGSNVAKIDGQVGEIFVTDGTDAVSVSPTALSKTGVSTFNISSSSIQFTNGIYGYTFPTANGTSGQAMFTNGSGQLYWGTVASGGGGVSSVNGLTGAVKLGRSISVYAPTTTDNITMFYTSNALTLSNIESVIRGAGTGVTFSVRYGTDRSATGTEVVTGGINCTNTTTGLSTTSFNNGTISASSFVWLTIAGVSGNPNELSVTLEF